MEPLAAARAQMGISLGFHIVFAAFGIGMPVLMLMAEGLWLRTGRLHYRELARKWEKVTSLLFAIGAVSGTALSFELGLLWPSFMEFAGSIVGPAFALEGFAFFVEAIFIGLYLYGWERLPPFAHWLTGIPVAVSGMHSGILVVAVNAWMQTPVGLTDSSQVPTNVDPWMTFRSPSWPSMAIHSTLSCYITVGFAVAGVYAVSALRGRRDAYHRSGLTLASVLGTSAALLQPLSGDYNGRVTAQYEPAKLAAMEAHFETQAGAPLILGGIPDPQTDRVRWAVRIPHGLSLLAAHDPDAVIRGLDQIPRDEWPAIFWVHLFFQLMVGCGFLLAGVGLWFWWSFWRHGQILESRKLLWALVLASPLGILALEAGWLVTELGRQPWVIVHVMRTDAAVTPSPDVPNSLLVFTLLYLGLAVTLIALLVRLAGKEMPVGSLEVEKGGEHAA